jgi:hypothetical protein
MTYAGIQTKIEIFFQVSADSIDTHLTVRNIAWVVVSMMTYWQHESG